MRSHAQRADSHRLGNVYNARRFSSAIEMALQVLRVRCNSPPAVMATAMSHEPAGASGKRWKDSRFGLNPKPTVQSG
jgi:hypothetical protein